MRSRSKVRSDVHGFTLLEVIIAVAVAGLVLVAMFQAGSTGLFAANSAARADEAVERAQSHLAAFGRAGAIVPGDSEGDDGDGYHWQLRARPLAVFPTEQNAAATSLYDVQVLISWRAAGRTRSLVLQTRRIGAAFPPQ